MSAGDVPIEDGVASERAVIGAIIASGGDALDEITLTPDDFASGALGQVFASALRLHEAGTVIDLFTLVDSVESRYHPAVYGSTDAVFSAANVTHYADIVLAASQRRRLHAAAQGLHQLAVDGDDASLADTARALLDATLLRSTAAPIPTMAERFGEILDEMDRPVENIATPWSRLNTQLGGGLRKGGFYVVGARPGIGKSAIALQLAHEMGQRGPVLFTSLEMPKQEVNLRIFAQQVRLPFKALLDNRLSPFMLERLAAWRATSVLNVAVDDDAGQSVFDIRNRARSMHRVRPLGGVVVDYLQLMSDPRDLARHEKVADMTRQLKLLSRELEVPVVACSQLNRESTKRADSRPTLSDLRESGSIEQDADVVILLDREMTADGEPSNDLALILAKNRQGQLGTVWVTWQGEFVRAMDASTGVV